MLLHTTPPKNSYRSRSTTAIRTIINLHCIVLNFSTTAYNCTHVYTQNSYTSYHAMVPTQMLPPQDAAIQDATTPRCHYLGATHRDVIAPDAIAPWSQLVRLCCFTFCIFCHLSRFRAISTQISKMGKTAAALVGAEMGLLLGKRG